MKDQGYSTDIIHSSSTASVERPNNTLLSILSVTILVSGILTAALFAITKIIKKITKPSSQR